MDSPPPSLGGWMAQEWVSGGEFSSWAWCMSGEVRTITFYECPVRAGRGAGCAFAPIWEEAAAGFVSEMARALQFTGSLAFDFIRPEPGQFKVIECNPRLTSGLHVLDPAIQLSDLLRNPGPIPPPMQSALLRLPTFLSKPALAWSSPDVTSATDDPGPAWGQVIGIAEFAGIAMRNRVSLSAATTLDIEYNGE